jgi:hypothetical protein
MTRQKRFLVLATLVVALLLALSIYLRSWGGVALILVVAGGLAWYRVQVARGEATERFFGDAGEDTRMTGFQGGSPSEMPVDRNGDTAREEPRH